jgi:hypothetical protein
MLADAVSAVARRGGAIPEEILPLWCADLAAPAALDRVLGGTAAERKSLAAALGGRVLPPDRRLLARLLLDSDLEVRRVAGVALFAVAGDRIPFDPEWDEPRRRGAAAALEQLDVGR